ncbi:hypothetical protein AB6A40_004735 [Gnathostoma spinigerum]|uniref:GtrA-like protein domain-containing protein n=1 Tax=Gnathostoma spinigerum TaxID=75299 RepID=A0ABD6EKS9_9BILA
MAFLSRILEWRHAFFPRLSSKTILSFYLPLGGAACHTLHTVHIFYPQYLSRIFPVFDLTVSNSLLFLSNLGAGLYVYSRPHLYRVAAYDRVEFSVFSSVMFNFGSILLAVLLKALLPERSNGLLRSLIGVGLSWILLSRGHKYLRYIDSRTISSGGKPRHNTSTAGSR